MAEPAALARRQKNVSHRFALLFVAYLGVAALAYPLLARRFETAMDALMTATAQVVCRILGAFTSDTGVVGTVVQLGDFGLEIILECTALHEVMILAAAVLAVPTTMKKKAVGLVAGIPLLVAVNIARLTILMAIGRHYPDVFDFVHLYLWQATMIAVVVSIWLVWMLKLVRDE